MNQSILSRFVGGGTVAALAGLVACGAATAGTGGRSQTMYMPGSNMVMDPSTTPYSKVAPYPIDSVWHVVPSAFDSLTIPLTTLDPAKHVVANEGFKVRQTIGKVRLSNYFECGSTQVGPNADSYELYVTIFTVLEPVGLRGTRITTTIEAAAKPMQFAQDYSRCTSKGDLESLITDIIISRIRK